MSALTSDLLLGTNGPDTLEGGPGNDTLVGAAGRDVAVLSGSSADFQFGWRDGYLLLTDRVGDQGSDDLLQVETLRFSDRDITLRSGGAIRVDSTAVDAQGEGVVAATPDGGFCYVYGDWHLGDDNLRDLLLQRFDAAREAIGPPIVIAQSPSAPRYPVTVGLADGRVLVAWQQYDSELSIQARFIGTDGQPEGDAFQVDPGAGNASYPFATVLPGHGFVVAWSASDDDASGVFMRRFLDDGSADGEVVPVNTTTIGTQAATSICTLSDGGFLVVWQAAPQDAGGWRVCAQRFSAEGAPTGGELNLVETAPTDEYRPPGPAVAAVPEGGFLLSWTEWESTDVHSGRELYVRRFDADGNAAGDSILVDTQPAGYACDPIAVPLADGRFVVAWNDVADGVVVQIFTESGTRLGSELHLSSSGDVADGYIRTEVFDDGGFALAWGGGAYPSFDAYVARFDAHGRLLLPRLQGTAANDTFDLRGEGNLEASGRGGDDTYLLHAGDRAIEFAGQGVDSIVADFSTRLPDHVENLELAGSMPLDGSGNGLANTLRGNGAHNVLRGFGGADTLEGGGAADRLVGGNGNDQLAGGAGVDRFVFDCTLDAAGNFDLVVDFTTGVDKLVLDADVFSAFTAGTTVSAAQIRRGNGATEATTAEHHLIFDNATGALYYDPDGVGGADAVQFAQLGMGTHPMLRATDFVIAS